MSDYSELKRVAEAATPGPWYQHGGIMQVLSHDCETVCETFEDDGECPDAQFIAAANPAAVLALIAENEQLAKTADCWDRLNVQNKALSDSFRAERDQLKAEVAGLRTGYEAYEQVNAELKAENERLERNRDMWKGQVERQAEEMTALRKDADRYRWLRVKQTFIWLIQDWLPSNAVLTDVDAEIDAAMSKRAQSRAT